jgi:GNAT superfamily N-acetyltransferase
MDMDPRNAHPDEIEALARVWFDGWHDAHAAIVPEALARHRTVESFRDRLQAALAETRTIGERGAPLGFTMLKADELYQFYVAREARGTGVASRLMADAEQRLAAGGVTTAWLACAIGNDRAARCYQKHAWRRAGTVPYIAETPEGDFPLDVWRYEKSLRG